MTARHAFSSLLTFTLVACGGQGADDPIPPPSTVDEAGRCAGRDDGGLEVVLSGAIDAPISWGNDDAACGGHYIEQTSSLSVSFAGKLEGGEEVAFIITVRGIAEGETGADFDAKVTIDPEEGLYSSEDGACRADITTWDLVNSHGTVDGVVRCDAPLEAFSATGDSSEPGISLGELVFRGAAA